MVSLDYYEILSDQQCNECEFTKKPTFGFVKNAVADPGISKPGGGRSF